MGAYVLRTPFPHSTHGGINTCPAIYNILQCFRSSSLRGHGTWLTSSETGNQLGYPISYRFYDTLAIPTPTRAYNSLIGIKSIVWSLSHLGVVRGALVRQPVRKVGVGRGSCGSQEKTRGTRGVRLRSTTAWRQSRRHKKKTRGPKGSKLAERRKLTCAPRHAHFDCGSPPLHPAIFNP